MTTKYRLITIWKRGDKLEGEFTNRQDAVSRKKYIDHKYCFDVTKEFEDKYWNLLNEFFDSTNKENLSFEASTDLQYKWIVENSGYLEEDIRNYENYLAMSDLYRGSRIEEYIEDDD